MNSRLGPASGLMPTEKAAGKMMNPAQNGYHGVDSRHVECRFGQVRIIAEVRSVCTETSHPQAQGEKCLAHGSKEHIAVHLLKSGFNRNSMPAPAPGRDMEQDGKDYQ